MPNGLWLLIGVLLVLAFFVGLFPGFKKKSSQKQEAQNKIEDDADYLVLKIKKNKDGKKLTVVKVPGNFKELNAGQKEKILKQKLTWTAPGKYQSYDFSKGRVFCKTNGKIDLKDTVALNF